jgi:glycosyltransferase involved in cell wall biosynthesis
MPRRLRLLWVTPHLPLRGVAAARERWWNLLARLAARHDITLLAFVDADDPVSGDDLPPGLAAVHRVAKTAWVPDDPLALVPTTVRGGFSHPGLRAAIAERLAAERFDLVQYEFVEMANLAPPTDVPTILTVHQLGFAQEGPRWRAGGRRLGAAAVAVFRHLRDLDWELAAVGSVHHVVTMTPEDAARLGRFLPELRVSVSPMGVDTTHYAPPPGPTTRVADVLFVGHFGHPPNVDAVRFLLDEVLPRAGRPLRVRVVGHGAREAVRPGPSVEVLGPVADVRPHVAAAAMVVAPVRFGTGMRGKVLEALALGAPVVTTRLGAEGLDAVSGEHLLMADGAADFGAAMLRILENPALAARLGAAGRGLVVQRFQWDTIAAAHDRIYDAVLSDPGPPPTPLTKSGGRLRRTARFGQLPALGAGTAFVATRGLRHYLGRLGRGLRGLRIDSVPRATARAVAWA